MTKHLYPVLASTALFLVPAIAHAQTYQPSNRVPVADSTLGTQVSGNGNNFNITGGVNKGQTLFHSFTDFSVPTNGQANFTNPVGNRDIITRVTGSVFSDINGLVNTNGANFFLINPNGITFGTNARLNVGKAFVGSTANSIDLVDGSGRAITFGTNANGDALLLTIAPNVLFNVSSLNIGGGSGQINNFGKLQNITPNQNQYIGLIGGNVSFDGRKDGFGSGSFSTIEKGAVGKGGNIEITTGNLAVTNGAVLSVSTFGTGDAGNVKITATGDISFDGIKDGFGSGIRNNVQQDAVGKGGGVEITTRNLAVTNGAKLIASTFGTGAAGNVKITATDNISFDGGDVITNVEQGAVGKGGGMEIVTRNLAVTNGAQLQASTVGQGDAGNVKIIATGDISFDGTKDGFSSGAFSTVEQGAVGKGGSLEITARNLAVTNGAILSSISLGQGDAGNIALNANNILIDGLIVSLSVSKTGNAGNIALNANTVALNKGKVSTQSIYTTGGDLNITTKDYLLLRNRSGIGTDSSSTGKDGNGGNITINSPLIIATPGNNDITANAEFGNGGRVTITSQGLFGIGFRPKGQESNFTNDITASSTFGQNGTVNISTPGTDPGKDSTQLPNVPTDASNQISQVCGANNRQNKLTVTGRGGLPPNANDPLTSDVVWQDARATSSQPAVSSVPTPAKLAPPAVGWVFDGKGKVTLVAAGTQGQPTGTSVVCPNAIEQ